MVEITPEIEKKFWSFVDKESTPDDCWLWVGLLAKNRPSSPVPYGRLSLKKNVWVYAHRLSAQLAGYEIEGKVVRHKCDNPPCVRPEHLETGTYAQNTRDCIERGRWNQPRPLTPEQVLEIRTLRSQGLTIPKLAERYGVSGPSIRQIVMYKTYKYVPWVNEQYEIRRQTHCVNGHLRADYGVQRSGQMFCRLCSRDRERKYYEKKRAARKAIEASV